MQTRKTASLLSSIDSYNCVIGLITAIACVVFVLASRTQNITALIKPYSHKVLRTVPMAELPPVSSFVQISFRIDVVHWNGRALIRTTFERLSLWCIYNLDDFSFREASIRKPKSSKSCAWIRTIIIKISVWEKSTLWNRATVAER
jgi:hypothetical protein